MPASRDDSWSVARKGQIIEVGFGRGTDHPQFAALHLSAGFLRLVNGRDAGWGSSLILLPCFWEGGRYHQGAQISVSWRVDAADLVMSFSGSISSLRAVGEVRLSPPTSGRIVATVSVEVDGDVTLDSRHGEAFKPVALSSMHVSSDLWDCSALQVGSKSFAIPARSWALQPPIANDRFGLTGGCSKWKRRAPSMNIELDRILEITGWISDSADPDDDNVALWAASDRVLRFWKYSATASSGEES